MSAYKDERVAAAKELPGPGETYPGDADLFVDKVRDALYCRKCVPMPRVWL